MRNNDITLSNMQRWKPTTRKCNGRSDYLKNKNILAYGAIGIIAIVVVSYVVLFKAPNNNINNVMSSNNSNLQSTAQLIANSRDCST